jgi:hypothetical protein
MTSLSEDVCAVCVKVVQDEGLQCDDGCNRWFHRSCVGIAKAEFTKLASSTDNKWFCSRADCRPKTSSPNITEILGTLVSKVDELAGMVNNLKDVPKDTKIIKSEIKSIQNKLLAIEPKLDDLDKRVTCLENVSAAANPSINELLAEINERGIRKRNAIAFNVPEWLNKPDSESKALDKELVSTILKLVTPHLDISGVKFFRLGAKKSGKVRPIKLIFPSELDLPIALSNFSAEKLSSLDSRLKEVKLSRDRTPNEIATLTKLRSELESRTSAGEENLTIKYKSGIPVIVKTDVKTKKN